MRSDFFDYRHYSPATWKEYDPLLRKYEADAKRAGQDPARPSPDWFEDYVLGLSRTHSPNKLRKMCCAMRVYFLLYEADVLVDRPEIRSLVFRETHPAEPGVKYLPGATYRRMQYYADAGHHYQTVEQWTRHGRDWEIYARDLSLDPEASTPLQMSMYFEKLGDTLAYQTCKNRRDAISQYLRSNGAVDVARSDAVTQTLAGIKRLKPPTRTEPMILPDLRQLLASFGTRGVDVRDKVLGQWLTVSPWSAHELPYLRWEWITLASDRIVVSDPILRREVTIDTIPGDDAFDTRAALLQLMYCSGSGFVFQRWDRSGWSGAGIASVTIYRAMHHAARRMGLDRPRIVQAMHLTFRREAAAMYGPTVVAQHLQLRSSAALAVGHLQERHAADLMQLREAPAELSHYPLGEK